MNTIFISYMLPFAAVLTVFYLLYKVIIRNDTRFNSRRFLILAFLLFAIILPFLSFQLPVNTTESTIENFVFYQDIISISADVTGRNVSIWEIIGIIYTVVVLFLLIRFIAGGVRLLVFAKRGKQLQTKGATIILNSNFTTAFSFFNHIFMPETWYNDDPNNLVLKHERIHVNQKHSWDLMFMELICIAQFFNPFAWLLKHEMRLNHEFLADKGALKNSENSAQYFELLLQKITGKRLVLTHSFNYSPIKNRIIMTTLSKPAKALSSVRYLAFVLVAFSLTFLFACKSSTTTSETSVAEVSNSQEVVLDQEEESGILNVAEEMPQFSGELETYLFENIKYPQTAIEKKIEGTVYVQFIVRSDGKVSNVKIVQGKGIGGGCDEEALRVVKAMPDWIPGKDKGKVVDVKYTLPIKFLLGN